MKGTLYRAQVPSFGEALRKGVAILGEKRAELVDAWEAADDDARFPVGMTELFISLGQGSTRCPVALHLVLMVRLTPVQEMDQHVAEGG
jgi:hypothetical protein